MRRAAELSWFRLIFIAWIVVFLVAPSNAIKSKRDTVALVTADDDDEDALGGINDTHSKFDASKSDLIKFTAKRDFLRGDRGVNNILVGTVSGRLHYLDGQSGAELWSFQTGGPLFQSSYAPVIPSLNGSLYMYSEKGLKKHAMSIREIVTHAPFALGDGLFYLGTKYTQLYAIDTVSGEVTICQTGTGGRLDCTGLSGDVPDNVIIVGRADYTIHAIDERTGEEKWNITVGEYVSSAIGMPSIASQRDSINASTGGLVDISQSYVAGFDGSLQLIDASTGRTVWSTVLSSPAVHVQRDLSTLAGLEKLKGDALSRGGGTSKFPLPTSSLLNANLFFKEQVLMIIGRSSHKIWVAEYDGQLFALEHSARPIASPIQQRIEAVLRMNIVSSVGMLPFPALPGGSDSNDHGAIVNPIYTTFPPVMAPEECSDENPWLCLVGLHPIVCDSGEVMSPNGMCRKDEVPLLPEPHKPSPPIFGPTGRSGLLWTALFGWIDRLPIPESLKYGLAGLVSLAVVAVLVVLYKQFLVPIKLPVAPESDIPLWKLKQQKKANNASPKKKNQNQQQQRTNKQRQPAEDEKDEEDLDDIVEKSPSKVSKPQEIDSEASTTSTPSSSDPSPDADGKLLVGKLTVHTSSVLGLGSSGTVVYEGYLNGRKVAVKRMLKAFYSTADVETKLLIESDEHPNVVRYYATEDDSQFVYLALSHAETTLDQIVEPRASADESNPSSLDPLIVDDHKQDLLRQIVRGVIHLHDLNIVHRDLKPQNILVSAARAPTPIHGWVVKISDMGLAKKLEQERASFSTTAARGTIGWQPPEVLGDKKHLASGKVLKMTKKVDIFALGCIFYYVLTGRHPFGDRYEREVNIMSGKAPSLDGVTCEARDLISRMISPDPSLRPEGPEILSHPFFWSSDRKLQFLRDASDFLEFEKPTAPIVLTFEKAAVDEKVIPGKNGDWMEGLSEHLLLDLNRFRKYNGTKLRDLLRIVRNKAHHYRDLPVELQQQLGSFPEGYLSYFISRYPSLVIFTFRFAKEHCCSDKAFADYFTS